MTAQTTEQAIAAKWAELDRQSADRPDLQALWAAVRADEPSRAVVTLAALYYQSCRSQEGTESDLLIGMAAEEIAGLRGAIRILERLLGKALER